jgi:hypothetical protein
MAGTTTISTELTLDDLASEILKQIQGNTEKTSEAAEHAKEGFGSFARETVSVLHELGINVTELASKVLEFGKSFVEVAAEGQTADQALAAMMSTTQGLGFDSVIEDAQRLGDEMDAIAGKTGAIGDLGQAFNQLSLYTGASEQGIEKASNQIYSLAQISRVMGRDVGQVTQEFALMQEGMLKPKGQLFQLLQTTGLFGDSAKKAAAAWGTITEDKRVQILDAALGAVTGKLEKIPPSFNNQVSSLKQMVSAAKEKIGEPFMEALMPAMTSAIDRVGTMTPALVNLAKTLGKDVGEWVNKGIGLMAEGFQWVNDHHEQIMATLKDGWADVKSAWAFIKSVVDFIVQNKETIMALGAMYGIQQGAKAGGDLYASIAKSVTSMNALEHSTTAAGVGLAIFAAAAVQITEDILKAKADEQDSAIKGGQVRNDQIMDAMRRGDVEKIERLQVNRQQQDAAHGGDTSYRQYEMKDLDSALKVAKDKTALNAHAAAEAIHAAGFDIANAHAAATARQYASVALYTDSFAKDIASVIYTYNNAVASHDTATQAMIEGVVKGSSDLRTAFDESTIEIEGGMLGMQQTLRNMADLVTAAAIEASGETTKVSIGGLTGSGNVTVNMKQDFRQQDPDRVAVAFERSIERMAEHRKTATTSSPFGT